MQNVDHSGSARLFRDRDKSHVRRNLPIANFVRNNHIIFELPCVRGRIELTDQVQVVGQVFEDGLQQRRLISVQEQLLFEADAVITDHVCVLGTSGCRTTTNSVLTANKVTNSLLARFSFPFFFFFLVYCVSKK